MLRKVRLKNFIHFKDEQTLDFQRGPHFFIGQNNSGKSSVLEAIRRCMSTKKNTSFSNPHDPQEAAVVVCVYDVTKLGDDSQHTARCSESDPTIVNEETPRKAKFVSAILRAASGSDANQNSTFIKVAFLNSEDANVTVGIDVITENDEAVLVNKTIELSPEEIEKVKQLLQGNEFDFDTNKFADVVQEIYGKSTPLPIDDGESKCTELLIKYVDSNTVITFPLRSIAPLQWTNSNRISWEFKKQNYGEAQSKAEILSWYAEIENDRREVTEEENQREKRYFDLITDNSGFEFRKIDDKVVAFCNSSGCRSPDTEITVPLLKVPEGIYEAKKCSVLLALDRFSTVGLEDPERGMHPQMVERLRDLVLMDIGNKVIFITSHHPSFLAAWNIPRTFFFHRNCDKGELTFTVTPGTRIDCQDSKLDKKTPRIITSDHIATLFFAKRVLFLEGEGDYLFMSALRLILMKMSDTDERIQKIIYNGNSEKSGVVRMAELRRFLCPLKLIKLNGETHKTRFDKLCKDLKIERLFVLDKDAVVKDGSAETFLKDLELKQDPAKVTADVQLLETDKLFVWKCGKIEDAIVALEKVSLLLRRKHHTSLKHF